MLLLKDIELILVGIALFFFLTGAITSLITIPALVPSILYLTCSLFFIMAYIIQVILHRRES